MQFKLLRAVLKRQRTMQGEIMREVLHKPATWLHDSGRGHKQVFVDLGYRRVDADNPGVQIIHRGKYKSLSAHEKHRLKRL